MFKDGDRVRIKATGITQLRQPIGQRFTLYRRLALDNLKSRVILNIKSQKYINCLVGA